MKQLAPSVAAIGPVGTGGTTAAGARDASADAERANPAAIAAVTAIGYYLGSLFGLALQTTPSAISSLWPPNAFLLGVLLLTARRHWWIVLAVALPAHLLAHGPLGVPLHIMLVQFGSNVLQAVAGAVVFRRLAGEKPQLDTLKSIAWFIAAAALAVPALAALVTIGVFDAIGWKDELWLSWRIRFQSNALAVLTITPLVVLAWERREGLLQRVSLQHALEAVALAAGLVVTGYWIVTTPGTESPQSQPILYFSVPLLLLASVRFGLAGACLSVLMLASVKVWGALYTTTPLLGQDPVERALAFGLFLMVTAIPLLLLAALLEERDATRRAASEVGDDLRKLMESTAAIPWQADPASATITYIGPQVEALFGFPQRDWRQRGFWRLRLHPDDRDLARSIYRNAAQTAKSFEFECRVRDSSGRYRWVHNTVRYEHRHGKPFRLRGFMLDVTDRKVAQAEAHSHCADMAHLNRVATMGEFAASITHEVFQPLSAILISAQAAEMCLRADPPAVDDARELLAEIRNDDQRAVEIIRRTRNLLQKHEIVLKPIDMNELVGETLGLLNTEAETRSVSMRFEPNGRMPPVLGDRVHLQQVLTNLALNAFDALADKPLGERRLRVETGYDGNGRATLTVSDTGTGIRPEALPRLFEPLYTTKSKGLGMGLSITRTIVEAHNGRIRAENNPDGGARFAIDLPVVPGSSS